MALVNQIDTCFHQGSGGKLVEFEELYKRILKICPSAVCEKDNHGQIVIYTGMRVEASKVVSFKETKMKTVVWTEFAKRHFNRHFKGTYIPEIFASEIAIRTIQAIESGDTKPGDRHGSLIALISNEKLNIPVPYMKITQENEKFLKTCYEKRPSRDGKRELPFLVRYFDADAVRVAGGGWNGEALAVKGGILADRLEVVLYSKELLESSKEPTSGADYEIVSVNAEINKGSPMTPETIFRNFLPNEFGGTGETFDPDLYEESAKFWSYHAFIA